MTKWYESKSNRAVDFNFKSMIFEIGNVVCLIENKRHVITSYKVPRDKDEHMNSHRAHTKPKIWLKENLLSYGKRGTLNSNMTFISRYSLTKQKRIVWRAVSALATLPAFGILVLLSRFIWNVFIKWTEHEEIEPIQQQQQQKKRQQPST